MIQVAVTPLDGVPHDPDVLQLVALTAVARYRHGGLNARVGAACACQDLPVLVHPWDAPVDEAEWRGVLASYPFGVLQSVGLVDGWPVAVPTQFAVAWSDEIVLHLARRNPFWRALAADDRVLLTVATDWAYIPTAWKVVDGEDPRMGIPTTYYAAVVVAARAEAVDDAGRQGDDPAHPARRGPAGRRRRGPARARPHADRDPRPAAARGPRTGQAQVRRQRRRRAPGRGRGPPGGPRRSGDAAALAHLRRRHPYT